ncbi:alpha/beta-hydrolase [Parathielavia appendiculata]|uniref:Carboxylic ester hydrolase n=1 Tax=Parathielavia appendiculata TaxID=2587402 RepID=A0AAN6Z0L1_9PEZI|nr:alpha/beta-hydrolase [Parathielavia appendiculata]
MRSVSLVTVALAMPLAAASTCHPPKWTVGQTVLTTSGPVEGHAAAVASEVSEYLGIPYAQPPVGSLRFQPPVRYNGTQRVDGKNFGFSCIPSNLTAFDAEYPQELIEQFGITDVGLELIKSINNPGIPVSEDCLTLNIWTKPQTGEKRKAVMVWVHGGTFISGSSAVPDYNGQFFAEQEDVVLVTINYRVSFFGFPGNPHGPQNLGLLDQRLAVEWVRDNIAAFGGDPSRITLFGESAGGASVDHYTHAFASNPIIAAAISMSGTVTGIRPRPAADAAYIWYNTTTALNCGDASTTPPSQILSCMQSATPHQIVATLRNVINSPIPMPYSPTVDETLVFSSPQTHPVAMIPLLIGNNDNEAGLFRVFLPPLFPDNVTREEEFWHGDNQSKFSCPAGARAARSAREGNPTWRYRWHGVFANTELATRPPSGAYHYSEVGVLFGTLKGNTREEETVGRWMRGAWGAFARDPVKGLERYGRGKGKGWPRYDEEGKTLARIGLEGREVSFVRGDFYDAGC